MYHGFFQHTEPVGGLIDVEIWRQPQGNKYDQWGDLDTSLPEPPIPALVGREKVGTIYGCVFEPRTTGIDIKSGHIDGVFLSRATIFVSDPTQQIGRDDMFVFNNHNGEPEAWKLDGEGETNNYVSPFTGIIGGRELFVMRVSEMRGNG